MSETLNILIVDDDLMMVKTLKDIFEFKGYKAETARSGREALEKLQESAFDCLLSDIKMPDINGVELYRKVRGLGMEFPVVLMTAYAGDELVRKGLEEGVTSILAKPFNINVFLKFLSSLSKRGKIIVGDDDPIFGGSLKKILELKGFEVSLITDSSRIVESVDENIDMLLLDMNFNNVDGLDIYKRVRKIYPELPVIFMTGYREDFDLKIQEGLSLGAYACFYKPFSREELFNGLNEAFRKKLGNLLK